MFAYKLVYKGIINMAKGKQKSTFNGFFNVNFFNKRTNMHVCLQTYVQYKGINMAKIKQNSKVI